MCRDVELVEAAEAFAVPPQRRRSGASGAIPSRFPVFLLRQTVKSVSPPDPIAVNTLKHGEQASGLRAPGSLTAWSPARGETESKFCLALPPAPLTTS